MRLLFVMDPPERLHMETDSTLEMLREAHAEGIEAHWCDSSDVYYSGGVMVRSQRITVENGGYSTGPWESAKAEAFRAILIRKEPPYDMRYHHLTQLLSLAGTRTVNSPEGLRNANEKLIILNFPGIVPRTIVTSDAAELRRFLEENGKIILKPLDLFGGKGVRLLSKGDAIPALQEPMMAQAYLPQAANGDRRILLLEGKPLGVIRRVPQKGEFRANMALGGVAQKAEINADDRHVIAAVAPYLIGQGLFFVGLDVIGRHLLEINVTCPTGIVPIKRFDGRNITAEIIRALTM